MILLKVSGSLSPVACLFRRNGLQAVGAKSMYRTVQLANHILYVAFIDSATATLLDQSGVQLVAFDYLGSRLDIAAL